MNRVSDQTCPQIKGLKMGEGEEVSDTKVFSLEEVKKHAKGGSEKEVWMVIHDNVYDVTKFLDEVRPL